MKSPGCGGSELATCVERPGDSDLDVSTTGLLTSKLKALIDSLELVTEICEHGEDERNNEPGGLKESPISMIPVCGKGTLLRISGQSKEWPIFVSGVWTLALLLPFLLLTPWAVGTDPRRCDRIHVWTLTFGGVRWFNIKRPVDRGCWGVERKAIRTFRIDIIQANVR